LAFSYQVSQQGSADKRGFFNLYFSFRNKSIHFHPIIILSKQLKHCRQSRLTHQPVTITTLSVPL